MLTTHPSFPVVVAVFCPCEFLDLPSGVFLSPVCFLVSMSQSHLAITAVTQRSKPSALGAEGGVLGLGCLVWA